MKSTKSEKPTLMTMFRANVKDNQINEIDLPPPERLSKPEAFALASWAVTHSIPAQDDPTLQARIQNMYGFKASLHLQQLSKPLSQRIGPHVALATKHSLMLELESDSDGYYFQIVRKRAMAPDLCIRKKSAMLLLDAIGIFSPYSTETRELSLIKNRLVRSQASCIDLCMGHYHERLEIITAYGESNGATTLTWHTFDPAFGEPNFDEIEQMTLNTDSSNR